MKKLLTLLAFCSLLIGSPSFSSRVEKMPDADAVQKTTYVFICDGPRAYAYHSSKTCRGLSNCKHEILNVSLTDAINKYKRRACKICE